MLYLEAFKKKKPFKHFPETRSTKAAIAVGDTKNNTETKLLTVNNALLERKP